MDIQTFKSGVVKKLLVSEGDEVPVKSVIAIIEEAGSGKQKAEEVKSEKLKVKSEKQIENGKLKIENEEKRKNSEFEIENENNKKNFTFSTLHFTLPNGSASPAAKQIAAQFNMDIEKLQKAGYLPTPAHEEDIKNYIVKRYFTPAALKLLKEYQIDENNFKLNHKISKTEILNYIKENNLPKISTLTPNQKAVIKTVENAITKPTYLMFDEIAVTKKEGIKLTAVLIKALANAMQQSPLTRSVIKDDIILTYPASNISIAVAREDGLYMCVIKNAENKTLEEINDWLKTIKTKRLTLDDLSGSTFGISNLGMFNVKRFNALINDKDTGIAAFGSLIDGKIKVTFTLDHRILNGVEGAKFINNFKKEIKNV